MINEVTSLVNDSHCQLGLWCGATEDSTDLARMADVAVSNGVGMVCAQPGAVPILWPWLEGHKIKIIPRFYFGVARTPTDTDMSQLAVGINMSFKQGGAGAAIFVSQRNLEPLVNALHVVRDDLFFNKDLIIGLDIDDVDACQWNSIFDSLIRIRANGLMLALTRDRGNKSDFVGRLYGVLDTWNPGFLGDVYWTFGANPLRAEQIMRLTDDVCPALSERTHLMICS